MPFDTQIVDAAIGLGSLFSDKSAEFECKDEFVHENYEALKARKVFSAQVPVALGGEGVSHREMCAFLRRLAQDCPSTALAVSMHQHLVSAARKNFEDGKPGEALLEKVLAGELVLVSTGANDWLDSNGSTEKVEGGYLINAVKPFGSGSPCGDIAITSCAYDCPEEGPSVLHFPVSLKADGVEMLDDWQAMGMRATGSQTIRFNKVFVPDAAVGLKRPRGPFHGAFNVIVTVALPLIMSVYTGLAEKAASVATEKAKIKADDPITALQLGEMQNLLVTAQMATDSMIELCDDLAFTPNEVLTSQVLSRKTICANAVIGVAEKALEVTGGAGFMRKAGIERLLRDAHAGQFHPLPEKRQQMFSGRVALGLTPVAS